LQSTIKILLIGNHACANRGDCAIARGLWQHLELIFKNNHTVMLSRFPVSSTYLLAREVRKDHLTDYYLALGNQSMPQRLKRSFIGRYMTVWLACLLKIKQRWKVDLSSLLPKAFTSELAFYQEFDLIVQVGGSNLVDLYGPSKFDTGLLAIFSGKPLLLLGHSLGPFHDRKSRFLAKVLLESCSGIMVREPLSAEVLRDCQILPKNLLLGGDTAWLLQDPLLSSVPRQQKVIFTVRKLAPFEDRVGLSQELYNRSIAQLADQLVNHGYAVEFVSTCTGIDNYGNDDRMLALCIRELCQMKAEITVEMAELNDLELMQRFSEAKLVIATRLHSAILAMNTATPALALAYEHKTTGIMQDLELSDWCFPLRAVCEEQLAKQAMTILDLEQPEYQQLQATLQHSVTRVRQQVESSIHTVLHNAGVVT
jgi:colanic acid/amylovoran biosynthesis protein